MSEEDAIVLSLVERGWSAARECSLDIQGRGVYVIHIVKGRLSRAVHALIARKSNIHIISVPRTLFWPATWALFVGVCLTSRLRAMLVDNDRSYRRVGRWLHVVCPRRGSRGHRRVSLAVAKEDPGGYEVWIDNERISRASWYEVLEIL